MKYLRSKYTKYILAAFILFVFFGAYSSAQAASFSINPSSATIKVGATAEFQALFDNCPSGAVCFAGPLPVQATWTSSNTKVAAVGYKNTCPPGAYCFVGPDYLTAVVTGVSQGTATITATYKDSSATALVTVGEVTTPLIITTTSLPSATEGTPYQATVSASGGSGSYSWSTNVLPPGLSLVSAVCVVAPCQAPATISGTPTTAGTYTFTVTVTDGTQKASQIFTMTVGGKQSGSLSINPSSATIKVGATAEFQALFDNCPSGAVCFAGPLPVQATWTSSNTKVAAVGYKNTCPPGAYCFVGPDYLTAVVTGVSQGTATITATYKDSSATALVTVWTVSPPPAVSGQQISIAPTTAAVQVQTKALNVRQDAGLNAQKIDLVLQGTVLPKLEERGGWVKVRLPNGQTGWVFGQYVAPTTTATPAPRQKVIVTAWNLNVRNGPGVKNNVIDQVRRGDTLEKIGEIYGWIKITLPNGQTGWVYGKFVK